jgi:Protein of unknown function (DUF3300)/Domain of unknown function (DUF4124)
MTKIVKMAILIIPLLLVLPSIFHAADIHKWVDKDGTAHFTDDISKVPPEYRDQVKTEGTVQGTQGTQESKLFKQEELDQMLAPIALYPDDLLSQILMASTYPLEIVRAARWTTQNKNLKGDALTQALEKEDWDASVKSLVNFPDVLSKMNENLEWTQKLGDAFLAQQKEVMDTVQNLRKKAQEAGNLKTTEQQKVVVEKETIIIQPASPEVVYVPSYNPTVVYGAWWWPLYPPFPPFFLPPPGAFIGFGMGIAAGAAWGYAWGHANWHGGDIDIDVNRNTNVNNNINREKYKSDMQNKGRGEGGQGKWQHDANHRQGTPYRDQTTAQKFNRGTSSDAAKSRESFRGRADQGGQDLSRGGGDRGSVDRGDRAGQLSVSDRGGRDSAFGGSERGSEARQQSDRGRSSRESASSRGGGGFSGGGGGRGGGGGGRR